MPDPCQLKALKADLARAQTPRARKAALRAIDEHRGVTPLPKPTPAPYRYKSRYSSYYDRDRSYW